MKKSILIISALLMLYSCNNQAAEGVAAIEKGWSKRTIKVEEGKATVMDLLKAFNKVWPTDVVDALLDCAKDSKFTEKMNEETGGAIVMDRKNGYAEVVQGEFYGGVVCRQKPCICGQ